MPAADVWAADRRLLRILDTQMEEARRRAGNHLKCRRGCVGCCIGPFPITVHDGERLRRAAAALTAKCRARIAGRAREAWAWLERGFPGDTSTGLLADSEAIFDPKWQSIPCPLLNLESGACELYAHRPVACRTYGPLVRIDGVDLPACSLNYRGTTAAERDGMRVEIDPKGAELGIPSGGGETVVAYALK